jgi:hypothetical protein
LIEELSRMSLNLSSYESLMRDLQSLQHQSRAKYSLSALTMTAPLILTCTLCSILATLYTVSEERMTFVDSQEQVSYYCTKVLYLHVLNGMCTRGVTTGIDVDASCSRWSDTDTWKAKDETNLVNFNNGTAGYVVTDLASEVQDTWPLLGLLCQIAVGFGVMNLIVASLTLDTDLLYTKLKIEDPDLVVLSLSTFMTLCIFVIVGFVAWTVQFNSEVVEAGSWTNPACEMTAGASLGAYIFVIGGVFALASLLISSWALIRLYIIVPWKNRQKAVRDSPRPSKQKQQQQLRDDASDDSSGSRRGGDIESGGAAGGARLADAAGRPGYHIDTAGGGSVGDDSVVGDMMYDSDDSSQGSSIGASVRLRGQSKRGGGAAGAGGGGGVSIAASVEDSLKVGESQRSPEPTPPAKPPRPVKTGRSLASAGAAGGDGNAGSALDADEGNSDADVDRTREAVPYSPPSFTPEKPPKKPRKTTASSTDGGGKDDAVWSVSSSVAEVNTAAAQRQQQQTPAAAASDGIGSSKAETTGSTLAQRTKNKQRKTPASAAGSGGNNNDQQAEIARLRAALAAAEGAGAVNADIQAEAPVGGIAMSSGGGGGGDGKKKSKKSGKKLPPVR